MITTDSEHKSRWVNIDRVVFTRHMESEGDKDMLVYQLTFVRNFGKGNITAEYRVNVSSYAKWFYEKDYALYEASIKDTMWLNLTKELRKEFESNE